MEAVDLATACFNQIKSAGGFLGELPEDHFGSMFAVDGCGGVFGGVSADLGGFALGAAAVPVSRHGGGSDVGFVVGAGHGTGAWWWQR